MNIAQLKTKITAADIYLRGAVVSRHGRACLKQGRNVVYIDGCSSSMENDSICLRFAGNVTARSTCVRSIREIKDDGISSGRGSGLKQGLDIQKMIKQMNTLDREYSYVQEHLTMWEKNADITKAHNLSANEMIQFLEKIQEKKDSLYKKMDDLRLQKELLEEKRREVEEAENHDNDKRYIVADLWAELEGEYEFTVSYYEPKASWQPRFEISVQAMDQPMTVKMRGIVTQETEDNWENIALRLYSGNPNMTNERPVQRPRYLYVNAYNEFRYSGNVMGTTVLHTNAKGNTETTTFLGAMESSPDEMLEPLQLKENKANMQPTMMEYVLSEKWDIDNGKSGNLVNIRSYPMEAAYVCDAVPRLRPEVYLAAIVQGEDISETFSGKASVYLENNYVGEVQLGEKSVEPEVTIPLGRDGQVSVQYKLIRQNTSKKLLTGQVRKEYAFEIQIKNDKPYEMRFRVYDQIPVSRNSAISVEPINLAGAELNQNTGELSWKMVIGAGETRTLCVSYSISHPKDQPVFERYT